MDTLKGKTIVLTGASGGIGKEATKEFIKRGAFVIAIDIDKESGTEMENSINQQFFNSIKFYATDLSNQEELNTLCNTILLAHGCPDIIFNNATVVSLGNIGVVTIENWDTSYAVNLKAPILFINYFMPYFKKRNSGCFVFVSSSGAAPYMGAYETFKTAQVELSNTLAMELENTNICAFTIGPGLVKTNTAKESIALVAANMNISTEEFYQMNEKHILDVKEAGIGFALSVINAKKYHGQEISSIQVLNDFNYYKQDKEVKQNIQIMEKTLLFTIVSTFQEQYIGWKKMNVFERQWVFRDFKKHMGKSADAVLNELLEIQEYFKTLQVIKYDTKDIFKKLQEYWQHQLQLLQGYQKDGNKLKEHSECIEKWINDLTTLLYYFQE